jgi:hypothetical protein
VVQDSLKSISAAASKVIENEVLQAYARLDVHVLTLVRSRGAQSRITMTSTILPGTHMMAQCFCSIEEAKIHIGSIQRRLLRLLNSDSREDILSYRHLPSDDLNTIPSSYLAKREGLLTTS